MGRLSPLLTLGFALTLTATAAANAAPGDTLSIQSDNVNVYEAPSVDAPVVMRLDRGRKLKELRRQGAWVKVIIYGELGRDGWVKSSDAGRNHIAERQKIETEETRVPAQPAKPKTKRTTDAQFLLVVKGFRETFRATCRIIRKSGDKDRLKFAGLIPKAYLLNAKAVSCEVRKSSKVGRVRVELRHRGRIVASHSTATPFGSIKVRSPGPWGKARALRCDNVGRRQTCID